jgi:hypothetical protein
LYPFELEPEAITVSRTPIGTVKFTLLLMSDFGITMKTWLPLKGPALLVTPVKKASLQVRLSEFSNVTVKTAAVTWFRTCKAVKCSVLTNSVSALALRK